MTSILYHHGHQDMNHIQRIYAGPSRTSGTFKWYNIIILDLITCCIAQTLRGFICKMRFHKIYIYSISFSNSTLNIKFRIPNSQHGVKRHS